MSLSFPENVTGFESIKYDSKQITSNVDVSKCQ
jgi:hypothetical protein